MFGRMPIIFLIKNPSLLLSYLYRMNYLGHAFFSPPHSGVLTGNMISDSIKGSSYLHFPETIRQGIALHRQIDAFMDAHPSAKTAKQAFKPQFGLYAAPLVDVAFDYFIANDSSLFETEDHLMAFTQQVYSQLAEHTALMPPRFARMFPYMVQQNWLYNYRFDAGMRNSFGGLARRASKLGEGSEAFEVFLQEKEFLGYCYQQFMVDFAPWFVQNPLAKQPSA